MRARAAGAYVDLVFHALALIPVAREAGAEARAASLYRPSYRDAVAGLDSELTAPFAEDGALLATLLADPRLAQGVSLLALLHGSIDELLRSARWDLASLPPPSTAAPTVLAYLQALPMAPLEILRADLLLAAPSFARFHAQVLEPFSVALASRLEVHDVGAAALPDEVRVSATLGPHGRVLSSGDGPTILVGVDVTAFSEPVDDAKVAAMAALALHEHAVQVASQAASALGLEASWARVEAAALEVEARGVAGTPLERAWRAWRASLSTAGLAAPDAALVEATLARLTDAAGPPKNPR